MTNGKEPPAETLRVEPGQQHHGLSHETGEHSSVETTRLYNEESASCCDLCLVVTQGHEIARRFHIRAGTQRLGRGSNCEIRLTGRGISRTHAKLVKAGGDVMIADLQSTNGTWVNGKQNAWTKLEHGDRINIGDTVLKVLSTDQLESAYYDEIYRLTTTDDHTGTFNRRYFFQTLEREVSRAIRHDRPLALVVVDIDDLSELNEKFGPVVGDGVLVQIASRIARSIRREDVLARIGGDEFCLLLPETPRFGAEAVAERLRKEINRTPFMRDDEPVHVTASFGLTELEDLKPHIEFRGKHHNALRCVDRFIEAAAEKAAHVSESGGDAIRL
jgi:diguanylate cyclase (GGDEF)-like protein